MSAFKDRDEKVIFIYKNLYKEYKNKKSNDDIKKPSKSSSIISENDERSKDIKNYLPPILSKSPTSLQLEELENLQNKIKIMIHELEAIFSKKNS